MFDVCAHARSICTTQQYETTTRAIAFLELVDHCFACCYLILHAKEKIVDPLHLRHSAHVGDARFID